MDGDMQKKSSNKVKSNITQLVREVYGVTIKQQDLVCHAIERGLIEPNFPSVDDICKEVTDLGIDFDLVLDKVKKTNLYIDKNRDYQRLLYRIAYLICVVLPKVKDCK